MSSVLFFDPVFYVVAVPAVFLFGLAKGGLGAAVAMIAVPAMALFISPLQAAAILLPIICLMDIQAIRLFWGNFDKRSLIVLVPASIAGVVAGALMMGTLPDDGLRVILGIISVAFCLDYWGKSLRKKAQQKPGRFSGVFWGFLAGVTSTHVHAGGPPASVYLLPQGLDKKTLFGTFAVFFLVLNYAKLIPYAMLGQFTVENLLTSLVLLPAGLAGVWSGYQVLQRINQDLLYRIVYFGLFLTGIKLLYDGLS